MKSLQLTPIADLAPFLVEGKLVALNAGPDSRLYAVIALEQLDYWTVASSGARFPKITPKKPQRYRVIALHEGTLTLNTDITQERFNIHDVQPYIAVMLTWRPQCECHITGSATGPNADV